MPDFTIKSIKSIFLIFLGPALALAVFSFAASAHAVSCETYGSTKPVPANFGASFDTFLAARPLLIKTDCGANQVTINVGSGASSEYIYKYGHIYRGGSWQQFSFSAGGSTVDPWFVGSAHITMSMTAAELASGYNIAAYICQRVGASWKCGCRDSACASSYWQLQKFKAASACADNDGDRYIPGTANISTCGNVCGSAHNLSCLGNSDCDDAAWFRNPAAPETCDGHDNDCDGLTDESCDDDHDGYCDQVYRFYNDPIATCPNTHLPDDSFGNDCNDANAAVRPGATEVCGNNIDDDCANGDQACPCTPTCSTNPGCRATYTFIPVGYQANPNGICCTSGQTCYTCQTGYNWNGNACVAACTPTCAAAPGCRAPVPNAHGVAGTCCTTGQTCLACDTGYTWSGNACVAAPDITIPQVAAFSVTPAAITQGASVTASYTVTDNAALQRAELWRAPYNATNCNDTVITGCVWGPAPVNQRAISGTSNQGTLQDTPVTAGVYYYGLHAIDAAGNQGVETAPARVTVNAVPTAFYISTNGNDNNPGTLALPFKTITKARDEVRKFNDNMSNDIFIYLRSGTYELAETLVLSGEDSGTNGYHVVYENYNNENVIISGGKRITGWANQGAFWSAPAQGIDTRQLYINGVRAVRARSAGGLPGAVETATGYTTTDASMRNWRNKRDIELIDNTFWKHFRCPIDSITGNNIVMSQPCFSYANFHIVGSADYSMNLPDWIENAYELLDLPGEWYLDKADNRFYYIPRSGENMGTAQVIAPALEVILHGQGTFANPVHNIRFKGLTFSFGTWLGPNIHGLPQAQANFYHDELGWGSTKSPANIIFSSSNNITFMDCRFTNLGTAAIDFELGSKYITIKRNEFSNISGTAIQMGEDFSTADVNYHAIKNRIINNNIHSIADEYSSGVGLWLGYVENALVDHNNFSNLPYSGISVGWSGSYATTNAKNNKIQNNHIQDTMKILKDGGSIYSRGNQPGNVYSFNLIEKQINPYGSLYLDDGSANIEIHSNVVYDNSQSTQFKGVGHNIHDNWWQDRGLSPTGLPDICFFDNSVGCTAKDPSVIFLNNHTITALSQAPSSIIANAGVEPLPSLTLNGDFDGDNISDELDIFQTLLSWKNYSSREGTRFEWLHGWGAGSTNLIGDFDGNGYDDILVIFFDGNLNSWIWHLAESSGINFIQRSNVLVGNSPGQKICAADYDTDGKSEVIIEDASNSCAEYDSNLKTLSIVSCVRVCP